MIEFVFLLLAMAGDEPAGGNSESFQFERYSQLDGSSRAEKVDSDLRKSFPPGIQLSEVVAALRKADAACVWHNRQHETSTYICKHERKTGTFKAQTTIIYILFRGETCAVTDYKVGTGTKFGFSVGKSVPLGKDPAAHCFEKGAAD